MTSEQQNATKNVCFRDGRDEFKVQLEVILKNQKVVAVSDSTQKFFNYLKTLNFLSHTEDSIHWLNSSKEVHLTLFSGCSHVSFKIRKKAELLGLKIVPGKGFEERKKESLQRANLEKSCIKQIAAI